MRRQAARLDHPQVGGHLVACLQQHDITGNQVGAVNGDAHTPAQHGRPGGQHSPDGRHCRFGLALLDKADDRIGKHDGQDHPRINPVLQRARHHGRPQKDVDQDVVKLHEEPQHRPPCPHFGQAVGAMIGQAPRSLGRAESL